MSETYTPSVDEFRDWIDSIVKGQRTGARDPGPVIAEFDRMIEAVRAEEREKAAQIAEPLYFGGGATGSANRWGAKQAAARIRARGEEQGREPEKSPPRYGILRCGDYMGGSRDEIILTTEEDARSVEYTGWSYGVRVWMEKVSGMKERDND